MYDSIDVTTEYVTSENYQMSWFNRCVNDKKFDSNWICECHRIIKCHVKVLHDDVGL